MMLREFLAASSRVRVRVVEREKQQSKLNRISRHRGMKREHAVLAFSGSAVELGSLREKTDRRNTDKQTDRQTYR